MTTSCTDRIALLALLTACGAEPAPEVAPPGSSAQTPLPQSAPPPSEQATATPAFSPHTYWVAQSDEEMKQTIDAACAASVDDGRPVLLQFSAAWCLDCQALARLSPKPPFATELSNWHSVIVDVGAFDRHQALREAFGVYAIAYWVALQPERCDAAVATWPRLRAGVLEPVTGSTGPRSPEDVVTWLTEARTPTSEAP